MNKEELYQRLYQNLQEKLAFLNDKPEETTESTLKALWLLAAGNNVSAQKATGIPLPDLTEKQIEKLNNYIDHRIHNTPLAHLTNRQNFMGLELLADRRALIPRKETEILGNKALELSKSISEINKRPIKVIDTCCGSGNLGISIAYYNNYASVYSTDLSQDAVALTMENIDFFGLNDRMHAIQGDLLEGFESDAFYNQVDLIICNPPYIFSSKVATMHKEISSNEPALAFDGGALGINLIQKLLRESPKFLAPEGWLIFEVGAGQGNLVMQLCHRTNLYQNVQSVSDNSGIIRVLLLQNKKS